MNAEQARGKMGSGQGSPIAALDQSGGSPRPRRWKLYGVDKSSISGDAEMFDAVHAMRTPDHHQPELQR